MKIISKIIANILKIIVILIILLSVGFVILKSGINISSLDLAGIRIDSLYIKFNNKFIVDVKNIQIPIQTNKKTDSSKEMLLEIAKKIGWLDQIFQEVNIQNLGYLDQNLTILYKNDIFYVDGKYLKIDSRLSSNKDGGVHIDLKDLTLKDFNLSTHGSLDLNLKDEIYTYSGKFSSHEISGNVNFAVLDGVINYEIKDANATSLKNFMQELGFKAKLDPDVQKWIYGYVIAQEYWIEQIKGSASLDGSDFDENSITAKAYALNLDIKFDQNLPGAKVDEAYIELENGNIVFDFKNPRYKDKSLMGSTMQIYDIFDNDSGILIDLKSDSIIDKDVIEILKGFGVDIPILQKSGKMDANVRLDIKFEPYDLDIDGHFKLTNSKISISGADFYSKSAEIDLKNDKITIKNSNLAMDIFDADLSGIIDISKLNGVFDTKFRNILIQGDGTKIVDIKNFPTKVKLDFSKKDTIIDIDGLNTELILSNTSKINVSNLATLAQYSPIMQEFHITNGDIEINTNDFLNLDIKAKNLVFDLPFTYTDGTPYHKDDIHIKIEKDKIYGASGNGLIKFQSANGKTNLSVKDMNVIVKSNDAQSSKDLNINLNGENSALILSDLNKTIQFASYNAELNGKNLQFNGKMQSGNLTIEKSLNKFLINASDLNDKDMNSIIGSNSFTGGKFGAKILGKDEKHFNGEVFFNTTRLKNLKLYQQLLSFLDSIPSLLTLKTPDFNNEGFTINHGKIYFTRDENTILLTALELLGTSADIGGRGSMDLKTDALNIDLELRYLKDASSIINMIPLVNQIILGKNRQISTVIKIRGTLQHPTYETQVIKDILKTPYNLIKNTLELPFVLFN